MKYSLGCVQTWSRAELLWLFNVAGLTVSAHQSGSGYFLQAGKTVTDDVLASLLLYISTSLVWSQTATQKSLLAPQHRWKIINY